MPRFSGLRRLFRLVGKPASIEQDIDAELEFHFAAEVERRVAAGESAEVARAAAELRFGNLPRTRSELLRIDRGLRKKERRVSWLEDLAQDVGYAIRGIRRQPGFAAVIVVTLALGIGANATMFGLVDRLLLKPPAHVVDADQVVRFQLTESDGPNNSWTNESLAWKTFTDQRDHAGYFSGIAAYFTQSEMALGRGLEAGTLRVTIATPPFFRLLGVQPAKGRFYGDEEDLPGAGQPVAVLSWRYWQRALGGADNAIGQRLFLGSQWYTVIGIAPKGFNGVDLSAVDAWLPFHAGASDIVGKSVEWRDTYNWQWLKVIARLKPGVSRTLASDEAKRIQRAAVAQVPDVDRAAIAALVPLTGFERGAVSHARERIAVWLASVAAVVLLIVCANIANLLLARAGSRRREVAVRLALGVGRGRLVRQLLSESMLLACLGGLAALLVARWGGDLLRATLLPSVGWTEGALDWRVAGVTGLVTLLTGLLTGIAPALSASKPELTVALRSSAADGGSPRSRLRSGLLTAQACLSLVLLIGAGLFVRSLWRVVHTDVGYDRRDVVVADIDLILAGYDKPARWAYYSQALERIRGLPGVERASLTINSPFWTMHGTRFRLTDRDSTPRLPHGGPYYNGVTPEYFRTLGMGMVAGRGFTDQDRIGTQHVVVINERLAEFYWPGANPIGKCVRIGADSIPCAEVIGVVKTARVSGIQEQPAAMYYVPLEQSGAMGLSSDRMLFLKARIPAEHIIPAVREILQGMGPNLPFARIRTFQSQIDPEIQPWRLGAVMFGVFGGLALLVAAIGLYSVMSYSVVQRTHECGIRAALGARPAQVVGAVLRDGLRVTVLGMALGTVIALLAGRFLQPMLYQTSARDPLVFGTVLLTLTAASVLAILIPARRAMRVDPLVALRSD